MIGNYLTIGFRNILKHKVSTGINLLGLTIGIATCLIVYLIANYEMSYDAFHPDKERIYRVVGQSSIGTFEEEHPVAFVPGPLPQAMRTEIPGIETIAAFQVIETKVLVPQKTGDPKRFERRKRGIGDAKTILAEPQYFSIFKYDWLAGDPQTALLSPHKVVLTRARALEYFGEIPLNEVLGRQVIYQDSILVTVSGIVRDWNRPTDFTFTDFISFATIKSSAFKQLIDLDSWYGLSMSSQAYVKLAKGIKPDQLATSLLNFSKQHFKNQFVFKPALQPLSDLHFDADYFDTYSKQSHLPTLYGLIGVAVFILLLAAVNFINLATAQAGSRAREVGIRKVLGSTKASLVFQFLAETTILAGFALFVAIIITGPVLSTFQSLVPANFTKNPVDIKAPVFLVLIIVATVLLSGVYPSMILSSYLPAITLKAKRSLPNGKNGYVRKGLVVFQFTIAVTFIICSFLIGKQLTFMRSKALGFSSDAVVEIYVRDNQKSKVFAQKVKELAGVDMVTVQFAAPMSESMFTGKIKWRGRTEKTIDVMAKSGDGNFLDLYRMKLIAGRNYNVADTLREVVVNEALAKELGFNNPRDAVNQPIQWQDKPVSIVGVVADFHEQSFHEPIRPTIIGYMPSQAENVAIRLFTKGQQFSNLDHVLSTLKKEWINIYPDRGFDYLFVDDAISKMYEKERKTAQIVNIATTIAILISCLGIFGLMVYTTEQRNKEVSIRKALGASVSSIVALLTTDVLKLMFVAFLISSPIAWWLLSQWLKDFAYRIDLSPWVFIFAYLFVLAVVSITIAWQGIKAALVNPINVLRNE